MEDETSLKDIKALISQFDDFLSDNNHEVMTRMVNELDNTDDESEINQDKMKKLLSQLINQNNIDQSQL
ncbi:hypothetical protein [Sporohalobacter salinus]|uniref:hypothetical protein n=1 Tax=Sporohalobacter salinus TaxID=1494606 RepID=UPI0019610232|nr:hypothetical protein [Sporohalobacter salinus]MBM7622843.1 hemerythrin [Sporohalobacter salinus]